MLKFTAGVTKGNIEAGYTFNDPFRLGKVDPNYTSSRVVTNVKISDADNQKDFKFDWKPVIEGTIEFNVTKAAGGKDQYVVIEKAGGGFDLVQVPEGGKVVRRTVMVQPVEDSSLGDVRLEGVQSKVETIVYGTDGKTAVTDSKGTVTLTGADAKVSFTEAFADGDEVEFAYTY